MDRENVIEWSFYHPNFLSFATGVLKGDQCVMGDFLSFHKVTVVCLNYITVCLSLVFI